MKAIYISIIFILTSYLASGQHLYSRTFGKSTSKPIIFLHGGPGSSSVYFETKTARKLANQGFYVIIYDRRGEGRSVDHAAKINYEEAFEDLNSIYKKYGLIQANLLGFSFGGLVTTLYAEKYPQKVRSIILVSSLLSQQASYNTILNTTKAIYEQQGDSVSLNDLAIIEKLDTSSIEYRTAVFRHATKNGYFTLKNPDSLAKSIYATYDTDALIKKYVKNDHAVETFWANEKMKNIDVIPVLKKLRKENIPVYALY